MAMHIIETRADIEHSLATIKKNAICAAKEIGYSKAVVEKIEHATGEQEITNILSKARKEWDVNPDRWNPDFVQPIEEEMEPAM